MSADGLWKKALLLAAITVLYNVIEGLVSLFFGFSDDTLALLGFGIDSFIEVLSGIGVWHMTLRIMNGASQERDAFEKRALKITAISFFLLSLGLAVSAMVNMISQQTPKTTIWGALIALISIFSMTALVRVKLRTARRLASEALIADARCTMTCLYLSLILLFSSLAFELFRIAIFDTVGALLIAFYSFREGREALEKARCGTCCCH